MISLPLLPGTDLVARFNRLREEEPVCQAVMPSGDVMWLVLRYADVKQLYGDRRFSRDLTAAGSPRTLPGADWSDNPLSMVNMDGARHKERRRPVMAHLTARRIGLLRQDTADLAAELLAEMTHGRDSADFVEDFATVLPALSAALVAGVPRSDYGFFRHEVWPLAVPDQVTKEEFDRAAAEVFGYTVRLVEAKRRKPGNDATSALAAAVDAGAFPAEVLPVVVMELMFAGMLNTRAVLCSGLLTLMRRRDWFRRIGLDEGFAADFTGEALRCFPHPVLGLARLAVEDAEIGGVTVRRGEAAVPVLVAANRDPAVFAEPDVFDPSRPGPEGALSFGYGPHHCIGAALSRMQLETAFAVISRTLPSLRLAVAEEELSWRQTFVEYSVARLPVEW
ncbi:cytochrome P450 [Streptomyces sp. NPDC051172]|uniref:cytochrome P450 n=1 Tax=Streptomyces sp. NPDC051172 TaxID=3155796 RepID=UPI0034122056